MVGGVLGVPVLGETVGADGAEWFVLAVAAVVVIVATVGLARGEAATVAAGAGRDVKITDQPKARAATLERLKPALRRTVVAGTGFEPV